MRGKCNYYQVHYHIMNYSVDNTMWKRLVPEVLVFKKWTGRCGVRSWIWIWSHLTVESSFGKSNQRRFLPSTVQSSQLISFHNNRHLTYIYFNDFSCHCRWLMRCDIMSVCDYCIHLGVKYRWISTHKQFDLVRYIFFAFSFSSSFFCVCRNIATILWVSDYLTIVAWKEQLSWRTFLSTCRTPCYLPSLSFHLSLSMAPIVRCTKRKGIWFLLQICCQWSITLD